MSIATSLLRWDGLGKLKGSLKWPSGTEPSTAVSPCPCECWSGWKNKWEPRPFNRASIQLGSFPRALMSEAGQWPFGRFHNNVESGTNIPSTSQLQYISPLRFFKWSALHSFPYIINGSTTVLYFCHDSLTSQENKTRLHQYCRVC